MSALVVEGWSMTTGGGGPKSEEPACGGMKGVVVALEGDNVLATGAWVRERLSVAPLKV